MRISWTIVLVACVLFLSGCSGVPVAPLPDTDSNGNSGPAITGIVHGGEQPIVGARVYLFAAGTSGLGGASQSLLINTTGTTKDTSDNNYYVTTQSGGTFSISNDGAADYTCPSAYSQVYLYAVGGDPGLGDGANSAIGMMAALGACNSLSSSVYAVINEVSTIATAYALAGFATDSLHISSSGSALATDTDVPNAFASVTNLESLSTGVALATTPPPASNGVVPQAEIDTLADILAACVNSSGPGSTPCSSLFGLATNGGHGADGNCHGGDQHRAQPWAERCGTLRIAAGESGLPAHNGFSAERLDDLDQLFGKRAGWHRICPGGYCRGCGGRRMGAKLQLQQCERIHCPTGCQCPVRPIRRG